METVAEAPRGGRGIARWVIPAVGYLVSAASLVWVFSRFPYRELEHRIRALDWPWVALAVAIEIAIYFADAWRWRELLQPVGRPSFGAALQAVFVGIFANDVLPARTGELLRCFVLTYESPVKLPVAFASEAILRIMDGIWIVVLYLIVAYTANSNKLVTDGMWVFAAVIAASAALIAFVLFRREHAGELMQAQPWAARLMGHLHEIHRLGQWRALCAGMFGSGLYWLAQALAFWALARADGFDFGLGAATFVLVVKSVGTVLPNAPANIGAYQATVMYALGLLLVEKPDAQIFAQLAFWILTLPAVIGGAIAVSVTGLDVRDLQRRARAASEPAPGSAL